ncbi:MAG: DUF1801 domain-containing protein [Rhodoferax sp.]
MPEAKTKPTLVNVDEYLVSKATEERLAECKELMAMLKKVTNQAARMWGPCIVGYGGYSYKYESGRTGESCLTGFAIRGRSWLCTSSAESTEQQELLSRLGKYKMGKACLYFKRLADLDGNILEKLVSSSVAEIRRRHPVTGGA